MDIETATPLIKPHAVPAGAASGMPPIALEHLDIAISTVKKLRQDLWELGTTTSDGAQSQCDGDQVQGGIRQLVRARPPSISVPDDHDEQRPAAAAAESNASTALPLPGHGYRPTLTNIGNPRNNGAGSVGTCSTLGKFNPQGSTILQRIVCNTTTTTSSTSPSPSLKSATGAPGSTRATGHCVEPKLSARSCLKRRESSFSPLS